MGFTAWASGIEVDGGAGEGVAEGDAIGLGLHLVAHRGGPGALGADAGLAEATLASGGQLEACRAGRVQQRHALVDLHREL